jgi:hypothetical protein
MAERVAVAAAVREAGGDVTTGVGVRAVVEMDVGELMGPGVWVRGIVVADGAKRVWEGGAGVDEAGVAETPHPVNRTSANTPQMNFILRAHTKLRPG